MSRPRMWIQVGTWPPPSDAGPRSGHVQWQPSTVRAQWQPSENADARRRRWVVAAGVLGAAAGSFATLLIGQVCV